MTATDDALAAAHSASAPEALVAAPMAILQAHLGDRQAHLRPGALEPGQTQFFVGGGFLIIPDGSHLMLTGSTGFPPEQRRLCVPVDGGDPGRVIASAAPLLIPDTRIHSGFRQYLKTARMGSAAYAPLVRDGKAFGLIIVAALAGGTLGADDLSALTTLAPVIATRWGQLGGPDWLASEYARATAAGEAFFAAKEGLKA